MLSVRRSGESSQLLSSIGIAINRFQQCIQQGLTASATQFSSVSDRPLWSGVLQTNMPCSFEQVEPIAAETLIDCNSLKF